MSVKNFEIYINSELGRYGVATKDLKAGDFIFEEDPFAVGPKADSAPICLECHMPVDGGEGGPKCPKCGWPLCEECSAKVDSLVYHVECEVFCTSKAKFNCVEDSTASCLQLDCITPLRVLLAKEKNQERWDAECEDMEHHEKERRETEPWTADTNNVVKYLREVCGLKDRFSEELIQKAIGILEVNAFEARTSNGYSVRCLYPQLSIMAHSCVPNVIHSTHPSEGFKIKARVSVDVAESETLYMAYVYVLSGLPERLRVLRSEKYFTCHCKRCLDPRELDTNFNSLRCSKCSTGNLTSTEPLYEGATWICDNCNFKTPGTAVQRALEIMQLEVDAIKKYKNAAVRLQQYERYLKKYKNLLHEQHYIMTNIRHNLISLYGRAPGFEMENLTQGQLELKAELCRDVLKILDIFAPGKTQYRAIMLYELHEPLVAIAQKRYKNLAIDKKSYKLLITEALEMLEYSSEVLQWVDQSTAEGELSRTSANSVIELKAILAEVAD